MFPAPITDRKIRFALVGCGRIAQNHFAALRVLSLAMHPYIELETQECIVQALAKMVTETKVVEEAMT